MRTLSLLQQQIDFFPLNYITMALPTMNADTNIATKNNSTLTISRPGRNGTTITRYHTTRKLRGAITWITSLFILNSAITDTCSRHRVRARALHHGSISHVTPLCPPPPWAAVATTTAPHGVAHREEGNRAQFCRFMPPVIEDVDVDDSLQSSSEKFSQDLAIRGLRHLIQSWFIQDASQPSILIINGPLTSGFGLHGISTESLILSQTTLFLLPYSHLSPQDPPLQDCLVI
mgnify:CR=1 FL=1